MGISLFQNKGRPVREFMLSVNLASPDIENNTIKCCRQELLLINIHTNQTRNNALLHPSHFRLVRKSTVHFVADEGYTPKACSEYNCDTYAQHFWEDFRFSYQVKAKMSV